MDMLGSDKVTSTNKILCWQLTKKCTKDCEFCLSSSSSLAKLEEIDYKGIIDRIDSLGIEKISYTGGEPFLIPNLREITSYAKSKDIWQIITTNGDLLFNMPNYAWLNVFQYLKLSFYGNEQIHDSIMGKGHFNKLIELIHRLRIEHVEVGVNLMLWKSVIPNLESLLKRIYNLDLYSLLIQKYIPTGNDNIDKKYAINSYNLPSNLLNAYSGYFKYGIKFFNYTENESFQVVLDPNGVVTFPNMNNGKVAKYGSIFEENKFEFEDKLFPLEQMIKIITDNRLTSNSIITY